MYKIETHLHTAEVSACSRIKAREMIKKYHEAGYSTVFVADHFQDNSIDVLGDIPWSDKMTIFLSGYYKAKFEGNKLGVNVLPAAEFKLADSKNHYLAYGITKEFLDAHPDLHKLTIPEFSKIARENGIILIHAHPYRDGNDNPVPEYVDGVEMYNSNPRHEDNSERSEALVKNNPSLWISAGSDAHREEDVAKSGVISEYEIKTVDDFIKLLRSGEAKIIREEI